LAKNSVNNCAKAGALMCPVCYVEYVEVHFDFELDGAVLRDVEALRCPVCGEEVFSPEQQETIRKRLETQ